MIFIFEGESDCNDEEDEFIREGLENSRKAIRQLDAEELLKVHSFYALSVIFVISYKEAKRS